MKNHFFFYFWSHKQNLLRQISVKNLLIVIPCFNEQIALPNLLKELLALQLPGAYHVDIAVVNDHSTDSTASVAFDFSVHLINLPINLGIGGAVQCGLRHALNEGYDLAIQVDGDGQHPPREIEKLLACYERTRANLVIGSRFLKKEGFQSSIFRRMGISYFNWLNKAFTGKNIFDSTSGFRLFDKQSIALAAHDYPDDYPEPESLVMFSRKNLKICETPIKMRSRDGGRSSIRNFTSLYYCIKVTIAMIFSAIRN